MGAPIVCVLLFLLTVNGKETFKKIDFWGMGNVTHLSNRHGVIASVQLQNEVHVIQKSSNVSLISHYGDVSIGDFSSGDRLSVLVSKFSGILEVVSSNTQFLYGNLSCNFAISAFSHIDQDVIWTQKISFDYEDCHNVVVAAHVTDNQIILTSSVKTPLFLEEEEILSDNEAYSAVLLILSDDQNMKVIRIDRSGLGDSTLQDLYYFPSSVIETRRGEVKIAADIKLSEELYVFVMVTANFQNDQTTSIIIHNSTQPLFGSFHNSVGTDVLLLSLKTAEGIEIFRHNKDSSLPIYGDSLILTNHGPLTHSVAIYFECFSNGTCEIYLAGPSTPETSSLGVNIEHWPKHHAFIASITWHSVEVSSQIFKVNWIREVFQNADEGDVFALTKSGESVLIAGFVTGNDLMFDTIEKNDVSRGAMIAELSPFVFRPVVESPVSSAFSINMFYFQLLFLVLAIFLLLFWLNRRKNQ